MDEKSEAQKNRDEFIARVNAEFGGVDDWNSMQKQVAIATGGDHVYVQSDALMTRLAQEGYLITPHVGRCRFSAAMRPQDVGLDPSNPEHREFVKKYLRLGSKGLLPSEILEELDSIDNSIRRLVKEKYGIPTALGSFVPYKNLELMKKEIEELKARYFEIRDEIYEKYDELRAVTRKDYREFGERHLAILKAARKAALDVSRKQDELTDEQIVEEFVSSTMKAFPDKESAYRSFYVTLDVGVVQTTAFLSEQQARMELVSKRKRQFEQELALIERQLTEETLVQKERERQRLLFERERVKTKLAQEKMKQKAIADATEQIKAKYLPQLEQVFADIAGAVHGILYDTLTQVNEALKTNGSLRPANSKSIRSLVEKVRNLQVEPDAEVEGWIVKLKNIVDTPPKDRNYQHIREVLEEIREQSAKTILSIGRTPRTLRGAELPDLEVAIEEIEVARRQERTPRTQIGMDEVKLGADEAPVRHPRDQVNGVVQTTL